MIRSPILLIDDEPEQNSFYRCALESYGYNVIAASNGSDGLDIIHRVRPELVLSDILMPEMSGFEMCEKLKRADEKKMPILFLSANDGLKVVRDGLAAGGDDFLLKGADLGIIRERIDFWLNAALHSLPDIPRRQALKLIDRELLDPKTSHRNAIADLQAITLEAKARMVEKIAALVYASEDYDMAGDGLPLSLLGFLSGVIEELTTNDYLQMLRYPDYLEAILDEMDARWELKVRALYPTFNRLSEEPEFREAAARGRLAVALN